MAEYSDTIVDLAGARQRQAQSQVVGSLDDDPDDAARAVELSNSTGVPATAIHGDLEGFERQHQAILASQIVGQNPALQAYINSHPLAATISKDDLGTLDETSRKIKMIAGTETVGAQALKGFQEGFGSEGYGDWLTRTPKWAEIQLSHPALASTLHSLFSTPGSPGFATESFFRGVGGIYQGALAGGHDAVKAWAQMWGLSESSAELLARDTMGEVERRVNTGELPQEALKLSLDRDAAKLGPYVRAGEMPPPGLTKLTDQVHGEQAKLDLKNLNDALKEAQSSTTRERSPEFFQSYVDQITRGQTIAISAEAAAKLDDGAKPEGKLGFVPNLQEQLAAALPIKGDIEVPLSDWLAKVDPEVAKELADDIRVRPTSVTVNEAKELQAPEEKEEIPPPTEGTVRFYHGGDADPTTGGGRWVTTDPMYAANFRSEGTPKKVWYVDVPKGHPTEVAARAWDELDEKYGTNAVGRYRHIEVPEELAKQMKPFSKAVDPAVEGLRQVAGLKPMEPEKIAGAAIKLKSGQIFIGPTHLEALEEAKKALGKEDIFDDLAQGIFGSEGFMTSTGRHVGRAEAEKIALKAEQIKEGSITGLHSFDIPAEPAVKATAAMDEVKPGAPFAPGAIMPKAQQAKYMRLIEELEKLDAERQTAIAEKQIRKERTLQWKERQEEMTKEVREDLRTRPDHAADAFFRGKYYDKDLDIHPTLSPEGLTKEQRDALPAGIFSKEGLKPDDVAGLFGFQSGTAMLQRLQMLEAARRQLEMQPKEFFDFSVKDETYRRMRAKYGDLDENILQEAREHVVSPTQMDMLHEETLALATQAGVNPTFTKESIRNAAREAFERLPIGQQKVSNYLRLMGRTLRQIEDALLKGDAMEAYRLKQLHYYQALYAAEAVKIEKLQGKLDKLVKRFGKREVEGVDQENTNWVHDILGRVGLGSIKNQGDLAERIGREDHGTLAEFVKSRLEDGFVMPVADFLLDPKWKGDINKLSTNDWRGVAESLTSIAKNGRDMNKLERAGQEADRIEKRTEMIDQLSRLGERLKTMSQTGKKPVRDLARVAYWAHINIESIFNRWDLGNPKGVFTQWIFRDIADAMGAEPRTVKKYAEQYKALGDIPDRTKQVETPLMDPFSRTDLEDPTTATETLRGFTRDNLAAVIQNMGNGIGLAGMDFKRSNFGKLVNGFHIRPEALLDWVSQHATREDWERAQKLGDVFNQLKAERDRMTEHLGGVPAVNIPLQPFEVKLADGTTMTLKGWYHPVKYDSDWKGKSQALMPDISKGPTKVAFDAPRSYDKERTGYAAPLELTMDHVPSTIIQMIHDTTFRPAILNALKMFRDPTWINAVSKYYSKEVAKEMIPYLRALQEHADYRSDAEAAGMHFINSVRQNIVGTAVGLNPRTIEKHTLTAGFLSIKEVGLVPWAREFFNQFGRNEATAEGNWKWATDTFDEINRRHQAINETVYGAHTEQFGNTLREQIQNIASAPIAFFDKASAVPTAMAAYKEALARGEDEGQAVFEANRAVRRAHGSTALGSRPAIMRGNALAQTFTSIYNFYSAMVQRQFELGWQAKEGYNSFREGDMKEARDRFVKQVLPGIFVYYVLPTVVEEMVSKQFTDDRRGLGQKALWGFIHMMGGGYIGLRDMIFGFDSDRDTQLGILTSGIEAAHKVYKDVDKAHFDKAHFGKTMEHAATAIGVATGKMPSQVGKTLEGLWNYHVGKDHPKGVFGKGSWWQLLSTGSTKEPVER